MIEQQVWDIVSDVRQLATEGKLDGQSLAVAIMAMQDFIEYLDKLELRICVEDSGMSSAELDTNAEFISRLL